MPHKHKRRKDEAIADLYDLPPTNKAKPLKVGKRGTTNKTNPSSKLQNQNRYTLANGSGYGKDDTPRAFQRLLQYQKTGRGVSHGLDAGIERKSKKRKRSDLQDTQDAAAATNISAAAQSEANTNNLKIQPHERLSDFVARVDQALPLAGISTKAKKTATINGTIIKNEQQHRTTKHDKRLRKLQQGWRADEARIREREAEAREEADAEWDERLAGLDREARETVLAVQRAAAGGGGGGGARKVAKGANKKQKQKRSRAGSGVGDGDGNDYGVAEDDDDDDDEDPWAVLKERRDAPKGIFDVAQAPPSFKKLPREVFKTSTSGGSSRVVDVPRNAGSLRKREELGQTRADIIKGYRAIMAGKRA